MIKNNAEKGESEYKMYYYTDFNTMKLILQNGTLRFKQSTCSNDSFDSICLYNRLQEIAKQQNESKTEPLEFIYGYYNHNHFVGNKIYAVACFTPKCDSRLLWDAYTMNRKDRKSERYNGLCIEFNEEELRKRMSVYSNQFDYVDLKNIMYGDEKIKIYINEVMKQYLKEFYQLRDEPDQEQSIVQPVYIKLAGNVKEIKLKKCIAYPALNLTNNIDNATPLFKHKFWEEEEEIRGVIAIRESRISESPMEREGENYYYYDLPIDYSCISKIILGPEFADEDFTELNMLTGKLDFRSIEKERSQGTGIIRSTD